MESLPRHLEEFRYLCYWLSFKPLFDYSPSLLASSRGNLVEV